MQRDERRQLVTRLGIKGFGQPKSHRTEDTSHKTAVMGRDVRCMMPRHSGFGFWVRVNEVIRRIGTWGWGSKKTDFLGN